MRTRILIGAAAITLAGCASTSSSGGGPSDGTSGSPTLQRLTLGASAPPDTFTLSMVLAKRLTGFVFRAIDVTTAGYPNGVVTRC